MNATKAMEKALRTCATWTAAIDGFDVASFSRQPEGGGWNLGQVCDHVTAASKVFLDAAAAVAAGEGEERGSGLMAKILFGLGSLPPGRHKVPPNLPERLRHLAAPEPLSKPDVLARFAQVEGRVRELSDPVAATPKRRRMKHPVAGWLNAIQWYRLSEIHMRHHLRQLRRLEKRL